MTDRCSRHRLPGDPLCPELYWSTLGPPWGTTLFLCTAGHYVKVNCRPERTSIALFKVAAALSVGLN